MPFKSVFSFVSGRITINFLWIMQYIFAVYAGKLRIKISYFFPRNITCYKTFFSKVAHRKVQRYIEIENACKK